MKRWGLRASFLSTDTKTDAEQNASINHLAPNVLYMMLATGLFNLLSFFRQIYAIISIEVMPFQGALAWDGLAGSCRKFGLQGKHVRLWHVPDSEGMGGELELTNN